MATSGLGNLLVNEGLLTENDRRTIADTAGQGSASFAKGVLALGLLDEEELATFIATRTRFPLAARVIESEINDNSTAILSANLLKFLEVLPLKADETSLTLAMIDPLDRETAHQAEFFSGRKVKPVVATLSQIIQGLQKILPAFTPAASPLEEFLANHAESAGRKFGMSEEPGTAPHMAPPARVEAVPVASPTQEPETEASPVEAGADLHSVDTISQDAVDVEQDAENDPFAKMDDGVDDAALLADAPEDTSQAVSEPALDSAADVMDGASESDAPIGDVASDDSTASTADTADVLAADDSLEVASAADAPAEATDDLAAYGLETPELSASDDAAGAAIPGETADTAAAAMEMASLDDNLDTPLESEAAASDTGIVDRPMAEAAQQEEAALAQELGLDSAEMAASPGKVPEAELAPAGIEGDSAIAEAEAAAATSEFSADELLGEASLDLEAAPGNGSTTPAETSVVETPAIAVKDPNELPSAQRIAIINRTLLAIQMAASQEKILQETARGLGKAACIPGLLFGKTKDGGRLLFTWDGTAQDVKVTHNQLGQLDSKSLEDAAAQGEQGSVVALSGESEFMGLHLSADKGYIVSFVNPEGSTFIATFEAAADFKNETGIHTTMIELLKRVATRLG